MEKVKSGRRVRTLDDAMDNTEEIMSGLNRDLRDLCKSQQTCAAVRGAIRRGEFINSQQGAVLATEAHLCRACRAFCAAAHLHELLDELYALEYGYTSSTRTHHRRRSQRFG